MIPHMPPKRHRCTYCSPFSSPEAYKNSKPLGCSQALAVCSVFQGEKGVPGEGHSVVWIKRWGNVCAPYLHS